MGGEWRDCTIGDLCDAAEAELQTGPFGSQLHAYDYVDVGIPVVPTEAIRNRQIDYSVLPRISSDKATELSRHRLKRGDILFARRGVQATGHIGYVREPEEGFICGTGAIRLRVLGDHEHALADYLSHVLADPASIEWFKFHAIGATMPNLNEGIIRSFPLRIPPHPERRAIAHVLGTLDDKIELNRRISETLERTAQTLFRSWFVDFDPVRAKAEGREASLPRELADLFPDGFDESGSGHLPIGWNVRPLGDLIELAYGRALREEDRQPGGVRVFGSNGQVGVHNEALVRGPGIVVGRKGNPGIVTWAPEDFFCIDTTFYVVPRLEVASLYFLYFALIAQNLGSLSADSAVPGLNRNLAYMSGQVVPSAAVLTAFAKLAQPMFDRRHHLAEESDTIAALRDILLPKLISGELRVKDAERVGGEVV